eukprot:3550909-Prymnesium_polylepis.1
MLVFRRCVEEAVATEVHACDPQKLLRTNQFGDIVEWLADRVCARMVQVQHTALDGEDFAYIRRTATRMVKVRLRPTDRRFGEHDRVVCKLAGRRAWAAGIIVKLDFEDSDDPTGETQLPYLVKIDPPNDRLVCAPADNDS